MKFSVRGYPKSFRAGMVNSTTDYRGAFEPNTSLSPNTSEEHTIVQQSNKWLELNSMFTRRNEVTLGVTFLVFTLIGNRFCTVSKSTRTRTRSSCKLA